MLLFVRVQLSQAFLLLLLSLLFLSLVCCLVTFRQEANVLPVNIFTRVKRNVSGGLLSPRNPLLMTQVKVHLQSTGCCLKCERINAYCCPVPGVCDRFHLYSMLCNVYTMYKKNTNAHVKSLSIHFSGHLPSILQTWKHKAHQNICY